MKNRNLRQGFTLVELLISISIIALISSIGYALYSQSQIYTRDSRRKHDLRSISTALELYYEKNGHYPCTNSLTGENSNGTGNWIVDNGCNAGVAVSFDSSYINVLPNDPSGNDAAGVDSSATAHGYFYDTPNISGGTCPSTNGLYAVLKTRLENPSDSDRCELKNYTRCDGTSFCPAPVTAATKTYFVITTSP